MKWKERLAWFSITAAFYAIISIIYIALLWWAGIIPSMSWKYVVVGIATCMIFSILFHKK